MEQQLAGRRKATERIAEAEAHKSDLWTEAVRILILEGKKKFMTEPETALYLSRSERWVRLMRQKRILPSAKVGGAVRYETTRIDEAIRALERPSVLPGIQSANRRGGR